MFQLDLQSLDENEMRAILKQMNPTNVLAHAMLAVGMIQEAPTSEPADPVPHTDPAQLPLLAPTADVPPPPPAKLPVPPAPPVAEPLSIVMFSIKTFPCRTKNPGVPLHIKVI